MKWHIVYIVARGIVMPKSYNDILNGNALLSNLCSGVFFFLNHHNSGVFAALNFKYNLICEGLHYFSNHSKLMWFKGIFFFRWVQPLMMADFIGSSHRHEEGDLCPLMVCPGIFQRMEAVSLENNFSQACQVMEYLLDLHDRYMHYIIQKIKYVLFFWTQKWSWNLIASLLILLFY